MNRTYRLSDVVNERFLRLPLSLFANPNYKRLSAESKLVYSLLLDRMSLSQKNNWINEDGEVYLIYKREEIADILCITYKKAIAAFKELITAGLLLEKRQGRGFPNRLFVLKCELEDSDAGDFGSSFDNPETDEKEPENPQDTQMCENGISKADESACLNIPDTQLKTCQNSTSRTAVLTHQEVPKRQSIQTNNNYIKNIYTECNQSTDPALAEILQNCELKSFESKTAQMLESAVRVLYYKQSIKLSGAVLPQTEIRNLLRKVNRDTLIDAVEVLRHNENEVQNPQGYLYSVILNAVNAEHTSTLLELPDNMIDREMLYASD